MDLFSSVQIILPAEFAPILMGVTLIGALSLGGVFSHLNSYTRRPYFSYWTVSWIALGLWLAMALVNVNSAVAPWVNFAKPVALALAATLHFAGALCFKGVNIRPAQFAGVAVAVVAWCYLGVFVFADRLPWQAILNGWLGASYGYIALGFLRSRLDKGYVGAGLLFAVFLIASAGFLAAAFSPRALKSMGSGGILLVGGLQWFLAVAMVVLLMEELRRARLITAEAEGVSTRELEAADMPLTSVLDTSVKGMSRELNEPLSITTGYLDLVLRDKNLSGETREVLEKVAQENERMARMLQHFLAAVRPGMSRREEISLNQLVNDVVDTRRSEVRVGGVEVILDLDPYLPSVAVLTERVENAVHALVSSALEAVSKKDGPRRICIRTERGDRVLRLSVEHTGAPVELPTSESAPASTGEKPAAVRAMSAVEVARAAAAEHNGRCLSETTEFGGSRVTLEIPITHSQPTLVQSEMNTDILKRTEASAEKKTPVVLVVDDEPMITELLKEMLDALGYESIVCNQGDAALGALDKWRFDAVMSDFRMPGMDGRRFYKEVTARKPEMGGRFIFLTGDTCNSETLDFVESVGARCIGKPFHLETMNKTLNEVLQQPLPKAA